MELLDRLKDNDADHPSRFKYPSPRSIRSRWAYMGSTRASQTAQARSAEPVLREQVRDRLAPSEAYAALTCLLARIVVTETTHLIAILFFEHHVTVRTELFVIRDARSADV
jgi:hypothetical protein